MTVRCFVCKSDNSDDAEVCERCGVSLARAGIQAGERFSIRIVGDETGMHALDVSPVEGCIMGRSDESSDYEPDLDLASYGAKARGVSRRHAAFVVYRGMTHILDLQSVNGTYVNGRRILPDEPHVLNHGDDVRLGQITLNIMKP